MKPTMILAIVLILGGAAILAYRGFSYKTEEKVVDLGPIQATAERTKTVPLPPIIGWAMIGTGAAVLVLGSRGKAI